MNSTTRYRKGLISSSILLHILLIQREVPFHTFAVKPIYKMEDEKGVITRRNLGDMAFEKGAFNTAIKYYLRAIARHPKGPWAWWHIANAKFEQGEFRESIKFCTMAANVVPQVG